MKTEDQLKAEIESLGSMTEVGLFTQSRTATIKEFPESWRKLLRESLDEQIVQIKAHGADA